MSVGRYDGGCVVVVVVMVFFARKGRTVLILASDSELEQAKVRRWGERNASCTASW